MSTIKTTVVQTARGCRVWIEGAKLAEAGFCPNERYNLKYNDAEKRVELSLHPEGKRKVSNSQRNGVDRPIIDIETKKIGKFFGVGTELLVLLDHGRIHIFDNLITYPELKKRVIEFYPEHGNIRVGLKNWQEKPFIFSL